MIVIVWARTQSESIVNHIDKRKRRTIAKPGKKKGEETGQSERGSEE